MAWTISKLAYGVAKYLSKARSTFVDDNNNDMLIECLNAARIEAQQNHDFQLAKGQAWVAVDPDNGGDWFNQAKLFNGEQVLTNVPVSVMSIDTVYMQDVINPLVWWPLLLSDKKTLAIKAKEQNYLYRGYPNPYGSYLDTPLTRYATDPRNLWPTRPLRAYLQGPIMKIDPRPEITKNCKADVQLWLNDYLANTTCMVASSSTASPTVTLSSTPADFVAGVTTTSGTYLLGQFVQTIAGTTITLAGNANATIASPTSVPYSNMGVAILNNEDYTDWFVDKAGNYLLYYAICMANMTGLKFVERAAGFLTAPNDVVQRAFQSLVTWDNYMNVTGQQPWTMR